MQLFLDDGRNVGFSSRLFAAPKGLGDCGEKVMSHYK